MQSNEDSAQPKINKLKKQKQNLAFPGGLVVKNPPANAGDRKIPHAMEQRSQLESSPPFAATRESPHTATKTSTAKK